MQAAGKLLSAVETENSERRHQLELNGVSALKAVFGTERKKFRMRLALVEADVETESEECDATWYDSRERRPGRTEYRLYLSSRLLLRAEAGWLFAILNDGITTGIIADPACAPWLVELLGLGSLSRRFSLAPTQLVVPAQLSLVLGEAGIDVTSSENSRMLEVLLERFHGEFPGTAEFSAFAREACPARPSTPDEKLVAWTDFELRLFKVFERHDFNARRLPNPGLDEEFELLTSMRNRRFSRAGQAFENHIEQALRDENVSFSRGSVTEMGKRPDFLFPGAASYHDANFPAELLTMLGAKTSLRDRWRQVASEADRIPRKHLITLQPRFSRARLEEARSLGVTLVSPVGMPGAISFSEFVGLVKERQRSAQAYRQEPRT